MGEKPEAKRVETNEVMVTIARQAPDIMVLIYRPGPGQARVKATRAGETLIYRASSLPHAVRIAIAHFGGVS